METEKVKRYFLRLGLELPETVTADGAFLEKIYRAHVTHIPYENIDYLNLNKTEMSLEGLFRQVVEEHRGGVCYDLNALLAEVLNSLGYEAYPVMADHYRTHMEGTVYRHSSLIVKDRDGVMWLSDVGDSFSGALKPLLLQEHLIQYPGNEPYQLEKREDGSWMLYVKPKDEWIANYAFREKPSPLQELSYYKLIAMNPEIPFTHEELFHIRTDTGFRMLRGRRYFGKNGTEKIEYTVDERDLEQIYSFFGLRVTQAFH